MKHILTAILVLIFLNNTQAQLFTFSFTGNGTCSPTQGSTLTSQPGNVTVSSVIREGLECVTSNDVFTSKGFPVNSPIDLNKYLEVTITPDAGFTLNCTSFSFSISKSSSGPSNGRVVYGIGNQENIDALGFDITTSTNTIQFLFSPFVSTEPVKFRIYGWNSTSSVGTMRIDDISMFGSVTTTNPIKINYAEGSVGIGANPEPNFRLGINGNTYISGKVAIGINDVTRIGSHSLAVDGSAIFTKAIVKLSTAWPDYVFEKDYDLPSLLYIEKYIKENKRLPGVPSASTIEKEGVDIGENQRILLKKIEELTLYIIDQNKRIELLEKKLEKQ